MMTGQREVGVRLAERLMRSIVEHFLDDQGGAQINIELTEESLIFVMAWLAAMKPQMASPHAARKHADATSKRLHELIVSAQDNQRENGVHEQFTVSRRVLAS